MITLLGSCQKKYVPRNISQVSIKEIKRDSTSIRAIHTISNEEMYYAGSRGDIVHTLDSGKTWEEQNIVYSDSLIPHFRSIASNGGSIFALSIASNYIRKNEALYP